jgi:acyl-CoA dehydrogenase
MSEESPFSLTPGQRSLMERCRRIGREVLAPLARRGEPGRVNRPLVKALARTGLLARLFPRSFGGTGPDRTSAMDLCLLREGLAEGSVEAETALAMQGLGGYPILQSARADVARRWISSILQGEAVAAFALTEPEHGSDAASLELAAERDGRGGFRLTGQKTWITNAPDADVYVVFGRTSQGARARGVTAFIVPGHSTGLSGRALSLVDGHPIGRLEFEGVFVSDADVLGEVDHGFEVAMRTLDLYRPSVGALAVGMAQAALHASVIHAARRRAFGKALREFQAVSHMLAEMATRIHAARLMVYAAASAHDAQAGGVTRTSAMAKLFATETAQWVVDAAIQVHGAAALERGHVLEQLYRAVRAPRIYEGTTEIQREIIARELYR